MNFDIHDTTLFLKRKNLEKSFLDQESISPTFNMQLLWQYIWSAFLGIEKRVYEVQVEDSTECVTDLHSRFEMIIIESI